MKKKSTLIITAAVALLAVIGVVIFIYHDNISTAKAPMDSAFIDIKQKISRRAELMLDFLDTAADKTELEPSLSSSAMNAFKAAKNVQTVADAEAVTSALNDVESALKLVIHNVAPGLATTDDEYLSLIDTLRDLSRATGTSRKTYNTAARAYNERIASFPESAFAKLFGFGKADYFEVEEDNIEAPVVDF